MVQANPIFDEDISDQAAKKSKKRRKRPNKGTKAWDVWRKRVDRRNSLKEWSKIVMERDGNKCAICGSTEMLNSHHILDKIHYKELQTDPNVGIVLCVRHHKYGKYAAHFNAIWFSEWIRIHRPEQYAWLLIHADSIEGESPATV